MCSPSGHWLTISQSRITTLVPTSRPRSILIDRKSTRLNSSHGYISYAVFCLKKKKRLIPAEAALEMATLVVAQDLSISNEHGSIERGTQTDRVLVDNHRTD